MSEFQNNVLYYLKNPFICSAIIALATYLIYSNNYMTKKNVRERFPLIQQRTMNIKSALYIFFVSVIVLLLFRHASMEIETESFGMLGGAPPF